MTLDARRRRHALAVLAGLLILASPASGADLPKVPEGFEIRLVAAVPAVQYPCQIATAPGGKLFVAEDPMDQIGPYEADNGRILLFDGDKEPTVFAEGLRAVFGLAWRDGTLYVMHMPYLSTFRDKDGDGKADERVDLFRDLGPGPKALNDHIVSGLQFGIDNKLYISTGDKGVPGATRPEDGRQVRIQGGGTLRCNPDGTGLEVVSTGTRNHLEPNLDDRDNLFTYDNTDDGDGWWTRVTHHIDGGYYGYPYDYHARPDRHLPRMAEYGGGSPCGAVVYREDAWPAKFRGLALWAEWGKRKVHAFRFSPDGASFQVAEEFDFVSPGNVNDFRPLDLAISDDGSTLYIADWSLGGWGNKAEKLGRVYAVTWAGEPEKVRPRGKDSDPIASQIAQLEHPAYAERTRAQLALIKSGEDAIDPVTRALLDDGTNPVARRHLIWTLDALTGAHPRATTPILQVLKEAKEADLRAQAARALGERDVAIAVDSLIAALRDPEPTVRLQAIIALGRIGSPEATPGLVASLTDPDRFLAFAARVALRRVGDWKAAISGLDSPDPRARQALIDAIETTYHADAAKALIAFALDPKRPEDERAKAMLALSETAAQPRPWDGKWWGTRPTRGQFPIKDVEWTETSAIRKAIRDGLADPSAPVRIEAVRGSVVGDDPEAMPLLRQRLSADADSTVRREVARALGKRKDTEAIPILIVVLTDAKAPDEVREASLSAIESIGGDRAAEALLGLLNNEQVAADRLPRIVSALGRFRSKLAIPRLVGLLKSPAPEVRAAVAAALGQIGETDPVTPALRPLVADPAVEVRKAAIVALGALGDRESVPAFLKAADDEATAFEATMGLAKFPDAQAIRPLLRGLGSKNPDLRKACSNALASIRDEVAPVLDRLAERKELSPSLIPELSRIFATIRPIMDWQLVGPFVKEERPPIDPAKPIDPNATFHGLGGKPVSWRAAKAIDAAGQVDLGTLYNTNGDQSVFGYAEIVSPAKRMAPLVVGSDDTLRIWVNGNDVYRSDSDRSFQPDAARVVVPLVEGTNRILIRCGNTGGSWQFAVAIGMPSEFAFLKTPAPGAFNPDTYRDFAMKAKADVEHGKALFLDPKGLACAKCHVANGQGGSVGPDLTGIATRYGKAELIESILFPSAKIFSGYEPVVVATADGRILTGIIKADTPEFLEIEDAEAKRIKIARDDIEDRKTSDVSIMPNGLAEGLTPQDFADLIGYLETLKEQPKR